MLLSYLYFCLSFEIFILSKLLKRREIFVILNEFCVLVFHIFLINTLKVGILYIYIYIYIYIYKTIYHKDKEIKSSYQYPEPYVKMCYNLQPVHNKMTLRILCNGIFFKQHLITIFSEHMKTCFYFLSFLYKLLYCLWIILSPLVMKDIKF